MTDDILLRIGGDRADPLELQELLFRHFGTCSAPTEASLAFGRTAAPLVTVRFNKTTLGPTSIQVGPGWQAEDEERLRAAVREQLLTQGPTRITRRVLFSECRALGAYRYQDDFQFLPLPENAPRPHYAGSDKHPFLLEVAYPSSSDLHIDVSRREKREREVELLLSTLLLPSPCSVPRLQTHIWVNEPGIVDGDIVSRLMIQGYAWPGANFRGDALTPISDFPAVEAVEPKRYYGSGGRTVFEPLRVPETLTASLDRVRSLSKDRRRQFMRACYWFQQSLATRNVSSSISVVALVSAIEALMPAPAQEKCDKCGRPRSDGPTKAFRTFIDRYVPDVPQGQRDKFYKLRSSISHGSKLLLTDEMGWGTGGALSVIEGFEALELDKIVRAALVNWLSEDDSGSGRTDKLSGLWNIGS